MSTVWCHLQEGGKCLQFGVTYRRGVSVYSLVSLTGGG